MDCEQIIKTNINEIECLSQNANKLLIYASGGVVFISFTGIVTMITHFLFDVDDRWIFLLICHYIMTLFFLICNLITFVFSFALFLLSLIYRPISLSLFKLLK